jgi:hypothetical protein
MTTFEVSNLGRYGYMGGRGGSSLREQSGAIKQHANIEGEEGGGHVHSHRCVTSSPLMRVLGLDRFTKGKAMNGMRKAGKDQNPFDLGFVKVRPTTPLAQDAPADTSFRIARTFGWTDPSTIRRSLICRWRAGIRTGGKCVWARESGTDISRLARKYELREVSPVYI